MYRTMLLWKDLSTHCLLALIQTTPPKKIHSVTNI
jgi:hypothetical protein